MTTENPADADSRRDGAAVMRAFCGEAEDLANFIIRNRADAPERGQQAMFDAALRLSSLIQALKIALP